MKALCSYAAKFFLTACFLCFTITPGASVIQVKEIPTYHLSGCIKEFMKYRVSTCSLSTIPSVINTKATTSQETKDEEMRKIVATASGIYDAMDLEDAGLSREAFEYAWTGYEKLAKQGLLHRTDILSICDFSQSSSNKRMFVIDVPKRRMLFRTYVAHGINSGDEFANSFSNRPESCKSSLGFYVTSGVYNGINGLSLRIKGVDRGFNDMAGRRNIVIHGAPYVSQRILHKYGVMGTSFGCPAIPIEIAGQIIPAVKNGTCFFIYYPSKIYFSRSSVLNG
jgi:hypothetical protein